MDLEKLVDDYISAWNRRDSSGLLALMHDGVAIYNAFWMESSVGRHAANYLRDILDEDIHWYKQVGDVIDFGNGVAFRYSAHELTDSTGGRTVFEGAEVLNVQDNKIITVSDYYCDPDRSALLEVAKLTAIRHGL